MIRNIIFLSCGLLIAGCTTLHTAASKGNVKAIERLVKEEANIDELDNGGKTPLMYAVILNQKESLMALLKAGANLNTQAENGNTALHEAVLQGNVKFGSLLIDRGAQISLRNKEGKTALDLAKEAGKQTFIELITAHYKDSEEILNKKSIDSASLSISSKPVDVIEPIPVIVTPAAVNTVVEKPKETPIEMKSITISNEEATQRLRKMIAGRETMGIRNFLNEFPHALQLIEDPMQRIRYIGPSGWRIIDIIENMGRGKLKESDVAAHILTAQLPYKNFTPDELKMLSRYGISNTIIDAMVKVTK